MKFVLLLLACASSYAIAASPVNIDVEAKTFWDTYKHAEIDIEKRADDYEKAYAELRYHHPDANIYAVVDGISIDHILGMHTLPNKSLVSITYEHGGRTMKKIAKAEEIEELGVRAISGSPVRVYFPQSTDTIPHDHHDIHDVDDVSHPYHRDAP